MSRTKALRRAFSSQVPAEGVEPTHPYGYKILSLARLPIPPRRLLFEWTAKIRGFRRFARILDGQKFLGQG